MSPRQPNGVESESSDYAVQLDDVRLWTPQGKQILQGIDWRVRTGERWTLLGPNGSGKSTILALAGAVRHPSSGFVTVLGGRLGKVDMPSLAGGPPKTSCCPEPVGRPVPFGGRTRRRTTSEPGRCSRFSHANIWPIAK